MNNIQTNIQFNGRFYLLFFILGASPLALRAAGSGSSLQALPRIGINASRGAGFSLRSLAQICARGAIGELDELGIRDEYDRPKIHKFLKILWVWKSRYLFFSEFCFFNLDMIFKQQPFFQTHLLTLLISCSGFLFSIIDAQTITGTLPVYAHQKIKLEGFRGFSTYRIDSTTADAGGNFTLSYNPTDRGMGVISSIDPKPFFVILCPEGMHITGESLSLPESIEVINSVENSAFAAYATIQPKREQALSAWTYLEKMYGSDPHFSIHSEPVQAIQKEKNRLYAEDRAYISSLPDKSYVRWYLPVRKLVSSVSTVAQYRTEEIPASITAFRSMNYTDARLYTSGLFKDAIEAHFWLLENSGRPLDSVYAEMQTSIDSLLFSLSKDEKKYNEVVDFLFDLLERHSLFRASEYLALKVLNETACTVDGNLSRQLETYRAMKKGNTAPDILFSERLQVPSSGHRPKSLSEIQAQHILVVFGASWCPKCAEEVPEIAKLYSKWKALGMEVVFISLDESETEFERFTGNFPFVSHCDFRKWEGKVVNDYYVFGTPTMFLLDSKREILLRPNSVKQVDAWVDWFLGGQK